MMNHLAWWQTAVFYQIYPHSFADGNGDGVGDLVGIIQKLDYLQDLGIDAIWLSPHYPSPRFDMGYDIADYTAVDPIYGTLDEFKQLLDGLHTRGMKLILDLVLNHTSDQHAWFQESRSSRDNPKRDWYIWRDGKDGAPPNNWYSIFGGPSWTYDETTDQYYYHFFFKEQPDLNWRNPDVQAAMFAAVRFWLDLGVDGFRLDAIESLFEHPDLPDHSGRYTDLDMFRTFQRDPDAPSFADTSRYLFTYQMRQPGIHELFQEIRALVDEYDNRVLVGETDDVAYHGQHNDELHLVFNFSLMHRSPITPNGIRANQQERLAALPAGAWPCNTLGNHDSPRAYSRFGDGQNDEAIARLALALMLTLRGTPFLYNGEEIGMGNWLPSDIATFRDNVSLNAYQTMVRLGTPPEEALAKAAASGRDQCRTPMQWDNAANAGFSPENVTPWLPVNPNYAAGVNVADQLANPDSLLNFYRRLLALRRQTSALIAGEYVPLHEEAEEYVAFLRKTAVSTLLVILNYSPNPLTLAFDVAETGKVLFSSEGEREGETAVLATLPLAPFEILLTEPNQ